MKQVAFVDSEGAVVHVLSPGNDNDYLDGEYYGGLLAKDIPFDVGGIYFAKNFYWDGEAWVEKPAMPSEYHEWKNLTWVLNEGRLYTAIRKERDFKLYACDWTQMPDAPLSDAAKAQWADYRQTLRDLPQNIGEITSLEEVVWPIEPV